MFSERKKSDRAKMAKIMHALAIEHGATAEIEEKPFGDMCPQMVRVGISTERGLQLSVDFDGKSCQPNVYVNAWNFSTDSDTCLSDRFPGSINNYHFRKCTTVSYGFEELCNHVRKVLDMAREETAFDPEREAAHVAKNGSWQERKAKFAAYVAEMNAQKACA